MKGENPRVKNSHKNSHGKLESKKYVAFTAKIQIIIFQKNYQQEVFAFVEKI